MNTVREKAIFFLFMANICMVWTAGLSFAGAWTLQEGKLYNKLAVNVLSADDEFDGNGKKKRFTNHGSFKDTNLNNYLEYGFTDRLSLVNALYFKQIEKTDDIRTLKTYGLGDMDLGLKYKLKEGALGVLSGQTLLKIPLGYDKKKDLPLGNGQLDAELRILYGVSLWRYLPGYANMEAGYRWRAEAPADEFRYLLEFGVDFTSKFYGRVKLDGILSMKNSDRVTDNSGNPAASNEYDVGKLDMAVGYKLSDKWGMEAGYMPSIYGKNTAAAATYFVGIIYMIR